MREKTILSLYIAEVELDSMNETYMAVMGVRVILILYSSSFGVGAEGRDTPSFSQPPIHSHLRS